MASVVLTWKSAAMFEVAAMYIGVPIHDDFGISLLSYKI
jgi:hypothetical protein